MSELNLQDFERKFHLRPLRIEDFQQLIELEEVCFPGAFVWKREHIESQLAIFPEGQIIIETEGRIVASSSSLVIDFDVFNQNHNWDEIADFGYIRNHDPEGDTLYGLEMMVHPDYRGMRLSRRLYDARKQLAREMNLMRIVIGGRIPGYKDYASEMSARDYVDNVMNRAIYDATLTAQLANGFIVKRILPEYVIEDDQSHGYATFLEWVNLDYRSEGHRKYLPSRTVRICAVQYMMRQIRDFQTFASQCEYFIDVASAYKSDFILFPEMITTQLLSLFPGDQPAEAARKLHEFTPDYLEFFTQMALKYNVNIIGGSHFTVEEERLYNISYLFKRNGEIGKQYKLHITPSEKRWWGVEAGNSLEVFDTDRGKICIQICYDVEFPELGRIAAKKGAQMIFVPFCTDERHAYLRVRYCAQARCIENQVYSVIAGNVGNLPFVDNMDIQYAQSGIFTPSDFPFQRDAIAGECTPNVETVLIQDVDLEVLRRSRLSGTTMNWLDRRKDIYEINVKDEGIQI